jgi:glutamyl-Q tRNA(Asp) synthetase
VSTHGTSTYRGRFAPSPTGTLHFGSLVAALGSWLAARTAGGTWLIRIEDLDPPREVPGSADAIIETLAAFGLDSDEPIQYQSERGPHYRAALDRLIDAGAAYPCWCSRGDLGEGNRHPPTCISGPQAKREPAWRLRVPAHTRVAIEDGLQGHFEQELDREVGDFVLLRADGFWAYHLAVVVDDASQEITEIVRGADLLESTPRQVLLQNLLGLPTPAYLHLPLALDAEGRKLSKQSASTPVDAADPAPALRAALAFLGFEPQHFRDLRSPEALLALAAIEFSRAQLPRRASIRIG